MTGKAAATYNRFNVKNKCYNAFMGDRLTKEELELVIEKHKAALLVRGGELHTQEYCENKQGCIMQHIGKESFPSVAYNNNKAVAMWFDDNYQPTWPDWLLRETMINSGLVEE